MFEVEDITDSMNEQGEEGKWYSVINNMHLYRVEDAGENGLFIFEEENKLSEDDDLYKHIRKAIKHYETTK